MTGSCQAGWCKCQLRPCQMCAGPGAPHVYAHPHTTQVINNMAAQTLILNQDRCTKK